MTFSRRGFTGFLLAGFFRPLRGSGQSQAPRPAAGDSPRATSRTYRADAVILFLGLSIYRRAGVGSGKASVEETGEGASGSRTFFFAGGSDPKRAHGLSRLGWMREVVLGPPAAPSESAYFGVLTASPEESLEHARKSYAEQASGRSTFSAVRGRNTAGHSRSAVTHFEFGSGAVWSDPALIDRAQATFDAGVDWRETSWPKSPNLTPPTFLSQLAAQLKQRAPRSSGQFVYSEQEYLLELETQSKSREGFVPVRGKIRNLKTAHETLFRMWLEAGSESVVPVRIEFQPRSFLRLTFEALPA